MLLFLFCKILIGGGDRIRTCGTVSRTPRFQRGTFNHSATPPKRRSVGQLKDGSAFTIPNYFFT